MPENKIVPFKQNAKGIVPKHQSLGVQTEILVESINGGNKFSYNYKLLREKKPKNKNF